MPSPRYLLGYVWGVGMSGGGMEGGYVQRVVMYTGPVMGLGIHPSTETQWWPQQHIWLASGWYASYWNAFLCLRIKLYLYCSNMAAKNFQIRYKTMANGKKWLPHCKTTLYMI